MKILVLGKNGQLAQSLALTRPAGLDVTFLCSQQINFLEPENWDDQFDCDFIINTCAYTDVEAAESEKEKAMQINCYALEQLSRLCVQSKAHLLHISTDYVFDGKKSTPYSEKDSTAPLNVYAQTKLAGENLLMSKNPNCTIVRTSWLYGPYGKNFYGTIQRLAAEKESLNIISDQVGTPTSSLSLAKVLYQMILSGKTLDSLYHFSNDGVASWYDFAYEISKITQSHCQINPIHSWQYPSKAKRPHYTVLNCQKIKSEFKLSSLHWKEALDQVYQQGVKK